MARYHKLRVWKLAMRNLRAVAADLTKIRGETDLRQQMNRAARGVVANIAE